MNSSEPVTVNQSLKVLEQLESFENSDLVIVMCYFIMSISKYLSLNIKGRVRLCVSQVISSFCQAQARLRHSGSVRLKLRLSDSGSVTQAQLTQSLG